MSIHTFESDVVVSKPRMTRSDKWKKRTCVVVYRAFADRVRQLAGSKILALEPDEIHIVCHLQMPASWSKKKKENMNGTKHQQKPDWDNIAKAFCDALYPNGDQFIYSGSVVKYWGYENYALVTLIDNK